MKRALLFFVLVAGTLSVFGIITPASASCTCSKQTNGTYWCTCVDNNGRRYCLSCRSTDTSSCSRVNC